MQALKLVTGPAIEPVTLSEVKNYLRIEGNDDNAMLEGFISAARILVEQHTGRVLITQTWDMFLDHFPAQKFIDSAFGDTDYMEGHLATFLGGAGKITIPKYPLQSVTFLKTIDDNATEYTMSASDYIVDTNSEPGRIGLKNDTTWPTTFLRPINGIQIRFVAGYGSMALNVPFAFKQAIQDTVGVFYEKRGCEGGQLSPIAINLLQPYVTWRL